MTDISVTEILKIRGKWIWSTELAKLVAKKRIVTIRHAWNLIKKEKNVIKFRFPDRRIICGLAEFGPVLERLPAETSTSKGKTLSKKEREERARMADFYADAEFVAKNFPRFQPLKDLADIIQKKRKEQGLE